MQETDDETQKDDSAQAGEHESEHKGRTGSWSKMYLAYWENAIYQRRPGSSWWCQLRHAGRRQKFSLRTPVKTAAAARARDVYLTLLDQGWDAALAKLKPQSAPVSRDDSTVGDFLEELEATADIKPRTFKGYAGAFRKIVADAFGIDSGKEKFDYKTGGRDRWLAQVHTVKLSAVTPDVIRQWKRDFLDRAEDPIRRRSAAVSCNSILRCAKTLFSPHVTKHLTRVRLPSPLPFEGVRFEPKQSMRYRSTIDVEKLTAAAFAELAPNDEPAFCVFLLALGAGLRKLEIDRLQWSAFLWDENLIRIQPTQYFDVKTEHSIGDVPVDPELMTILRGYAAKARSSFVIDSPNLLNKRHATRQHYRAHTVFKRLLSWLRSKGVVSQKPLHELRKESGSMVNRKHGLTAAKDFLRHADVSITAAHYIDRPRQATTGLGGLFQATLDEKIVPLEQKPSKRANSLGKARER